MRRSAFFIRIIGIGILFHVYIGVRLIPAAPVGTALKILAVLALVVSVMLIPLGMIARNIGQQPLSDRLAWIGLLIMGFFSSLLVLTFLRDIVLLVLHLASSSENAVNPWPAFRAWSALGVPVLAVLVTVFGIYSARRRAAVKNVDVPIDNLPAALNGFTIVQISDIHVGPTIKRQYVEKIVAAVNALKPDLIAVTGDVVDGSVPHLAAHTRPLSELKARHGAFLVTGNHEYYA
ncbi:metallophosphoesterase, partial [Caballeronia sp. M23-90]